MNDFEAVREIWRLAIDRSKSVADHLQQASDLMDAGIDNPLVTVRSFELRVHRCQWFRGQQHGWDEVTRISVDLIFDNIERRKRGEPVSESMLEVLREFFELKLDSLGIAVAENQFRAGFRHVLQVVTRSIEQIRPFSRESVEGSKV